MFQKKTVIIQVFPEQVIPKDVPVLKNVTVKGSAGTTPVMTFPKKLLSPILFYQFFTTTHC